jgi:hypothetical protein
MDMPTAEQIRMFAAKMWDEEDRHYFMALVDRAECEEAFFSDPALRGFNVKTRAGQPGPACKRPIRVGYYTPEGGPAEEYFGAYDEPVTAEDYRAALEFGKAKARELKEAEVTP